MTRSGGARSPSALPSSSRVSGAAAPPRSGRPLLRRRRLRNPAFAGRRLGGGGAYNDADLSGKVPARSEVAGVKVRRKSKVSAATATVAAAAAAASSGVLSGTVSARKLAAGIWQLQLPEFSAPVNCSTSATVRSSEVPFPIGCPRSSFLGFPELPELRVSVMPSISFLV
ncbi:unnamed protein product [Spirodela intermedia]|uniref:Uncharacterized protein n=1 Tax=Spirodela intermedia TaxID=51605 RepID=A0A7I8JP23_SPIIN|nr:unnamed protein product [Spirodela intermedia]CAA6671947.1 unnamed protein product [Spirodela intermedia]